MAFISEQVELLKNGVVGSVVVDNVRKYYTTSKSVEKNVSNVRRAFLKAEVRHPCFHCDLSKAFHILNNCQDEIMRKDGFDILEKFKKLSLSDQYDILRQGKKEFVSDFDEFNDHMYTIRLLPENMSSFKLNSDEMAIAKIEKRNTLINRNKSAIKIQNSEELLNSQINVLLHGSKSLSPQILACLFVSGIRECELLNGKSTFEEIPNYPYHVHFTGVLKKKKSYFEEESNSSAVVIPLLCKCTLFIEALGRIRMRQKNVETLDNKQVSKRYSSQLSASQKKLFPMLTKVHDLRGLYAKMVDVLFCHEVSFPLVCMFSLSHDVIEDCLHYSNIRLENYKTIENIYGCLGICVFGNCGKRKV